MNTNEKLFGIMQSVREIEKHGVVLSRETIISIIKNVVQEHSENSYPTYYSIMRRFIDNWNIIGNIPNYKVVYCMSTGDYAKKLLSA